MWPKPKPVRLTHYHPPERLGLKLTSIMEDAPWFPGYETRNVRIVDDILQQPTPPQVRNLQWQMTAQFYRAMDDFDKGFKSHSVGSSWEGGVMGYVDGHVEGEVGFKLFGNGGTAKASAGVEAKYGWMHRNQTAEVTEVGTQLSDREAVLMGEITTLYGEERSFQLDMRVRDCLLLMPSNSSRNPFLVCARRRLAVPESWYYMADFDFTRAQLVDHKDLRERSLMKMIRGKRGFDALRELVTGKARRFDIKSSTPLSQGVSSLLDEAFFRRDQPLSYFQEGGIFPGVIALGPAN